MPNKFMKRLTKKNQDHNVSHFVPIRLAENKIKYLTPLSVGED